MKYYHYKHYDKELDALLSKYFGDEYGAVVSRDLNGVIDNIEICYISYDGCSTIWTHYANIANMDTTKSDKWELNQQFIDIDEDFVEEHGKQYSKYIGTEQKAMYIYGYFKTLGGAVRNLYRYGTQHRKPKSIYV